MAAVYFRHQTGEPPAGRIELGRWERAGRRVVAVLAEVPVIEVWWSGPPERGPVERWYRSTVQPAIVEAFLGKLAEGGWCEVLVITPTAEELAAARARNN